MPEPGMPEPEPFMPPVPEPKPPIPGPDIVPPPEPLGPPSEPSSPRPGEPIPDNAGCLVDPRRREPGSGDLLLEAGPFADEAGSVFPA
jgi:hypothetical protein